MVVPFNILFQCWRLVCFALAAICLLVAVAQADTVVQQFSFVDYFGVREGTGMACLCRGSAVSMTADSLTQHIY